MYCPKTLESVSILEGILSTVSRTGVVVEPRLVHNAEGQLEGQPI